jgi:fructose-1,6-bisphosphatase I
MSIERAITLSQHVLDEERKHPEATGEFSRLLVQLGYVGKVLTREISRAALVGRLGLVGEKNATGDAQKKLDVYSNDVMIEGFAESGLVSMVVSEEEAEVRTFSKFSSAKYILCTDPLDGSSNTDINGAIGTIFGIYSRVEGRAGDISHQVLRKGSELVAAGYILYSTSTVLVYACEHGVYGFTLDRDLGEFLLSHENIVCPPRGHYYSANLGHYYEWPQGVRSYVDYVTQHDPATKRPYSLRYSGALVGDFHRSLIEGGMYFYPPDPAHPKGKLRMLYECAPLAFVAEKAGGSATDGYRRILEIQPESIHQQSTLVIGSRQDVKLFEEFYQGKRAAVGA